MKDGWFWMGSVMRSLRFPVFVSRVLQPSVWGGGTTLQGYRRYVFTNAKFESGLKGRRVGELLAERLDLIPFLIFPLLSDI